MPLPPAADPGPARCAGCRQQPLLPGTVVSALLYTFPVNHLVQQLKFGGRLPVAPVLGRELAAAARRHYGSEPLPSALLPVPLHPARLRQRGFNQAERLATAAGRVLGIPVLADRARRLRETAPQSSLDFAERQHNLDDAFHASGPLPAHVAIVDDVLTTGSTLQAVAGALAAAGAARIDAWTVARTL